MNSESTMNHKLEPIDLIDLLDFESDIETTLAQTPGSLRVSRKDIGFELVLGWVGSYMIKDNFEFTITRRLITTQLDLISQVQDVFYYLSPVYETVEVYLRGDELILVEGIEHLNEFERVVEKIKIHSKKMKSRSEFDFSLMPTIITAIHVGSFNIKSGKMVKLIEMINHHLEPTIDTIL